MILTVGNFYSKTLSTAGGTAPYVYTLNSGSIPTGMALQGNIGVIYGTPTVTGIYTFIIDSMDSIGCSNSASFTINITCSAITVQSFTTSSYIGLAFSKAFTGSGGGAPYIYSTSSGVIPTGLTFTSASGTISGTPTVTGLYLFSGSATDIYSCSGNALEQITINCAGLFILPTILPTISSSIGVFYTQTFSTADGIAPKIFTTSSGTVPTGLTLNSASGVLSGTPTATGSYTYIVRCTDFYGCANSSSYSQFIYSLILLSPLPNGIVGQPYV